MLYTSTTPARRRSNLRVLLAMSLYIALVSVTVTVRNQAHASHAILYLLSVLNSLPLVAVVVIMGLYLKEETDEFQRVLAQNSILWAIGIVLAVFSLGISRNVRRSSTLAVVDDLSRLLLPYGSLRLDSAPEVQRWRQ